MRFLMIVKATKESEAGAGPDPRVMEVVGESAKELTRNGVMVFTGGLTPSRDGVRLRASGGKLAQVDGPFAETTELVGGFAIFEVKSKEEAIQHGRRYMAMQQEVLGAAFQGELEIRRIVGHDDAPGT